MSTTRCRECHASIPVPDALDALVMHCQYCGVNQPVPDAESRRRLLLEEQREARLHAAREAELARENRREVREEQHRERDRKEAKRGRWVTWLATLIPLLVAPTIIAVTVFDAPARLGFGASGSDRLEQMQTQLTSTGCTVVSAIGSEYASSNVSKLVKVDPQCIRVFAAGGGGHNTLSLRLFSSGGKEVAHAKDTTDPQLTYCATAADTMRYEIKIGVASKGRLSHMVLACPDPANKPPVETPPKPGDTTKPVGPTKPAAPPKPSKRPPKVG